MDFSPPPHGQRTARRMEARIRQVSEAQVRWRDDHLGRRIARLPGTSSGPWAQRDARARRIVVIFQDSDPSIREISDQEVAAPWQNIPVGARRGNEVELGSRNS